MLASKERASRAAHPAHRGRHGAIELCAHLAERGLRSRSSRRAADTRREARTRPSRGQGSVGRPAQHQNLSGSIQRWRDFEATYGIDIGDRPNGHLFLFPESSWEKQLEAVELLRSFGVPV